MRPRIVALLAMLALPLATRAEVVAEWKIAGDDRLPSWTQLYVDENNAKADASIDAGMKSDEGDGAIKIEVLKPSATGRSYDIQFWIKSKNEFEDGKSYQLTVLLKGSAAAAGRLALGLIQNDAPYAPYAQFDPPGSALLSVDTEWKKATINFKALPGFNGVLIRTPCFSCGMLPAGYTLWIKSVKIEKLP